MNKNWEEKDYNVASSTIAIARPVPCMMNNEAGIFLSSNTEALAECESLSEVTHVLHPIDIFHFRDTKYVKT